MADTIRGLKFVLSVEGDEKTEAAVKKVDKAVDGAGQTAAKASDGGMSKLKGSLSGLSGMAEKAAGAFGKVMGLVGAAGAAIGVTALAIQGAVSALEAVNKAINGTARATGYLTEEQVKARTGLTDLTAGLNDYARSLGKVSSEQLTVLQRMDAMRAVANGGSQNRAAAANQFGKAMMEVEYLRKLKELGLAGDDVDNRIRAAERDAAVQTKIQEQFIAKEAAKAAPPAAAGGGGTRAVAAGGLTPAYSAAELAQMTRDNASIGGRIGFLANARNDAWSAGAGKAIESAVAAIPQVDQVAAAIDRVGLATRAAFDLELMQQWSDIFTSSIDQFGRGLAQSAANALLFGGSFTKSVNQAMKALAAHAASEALFEGAAAVASLALGRPEAAALHAQAAGLYAGVATVAALGASATGGLRSGQQGGASAAGGRAPRSQDFGPRAGGQGSQKQEFTIVIDAATLGGQVATAIDRRDGSRVQVGLVTARSMRAA